MSFRFILLLIFSLSFVSISCEKKSSANKSRDIRSDTVKASQDIDKQLYLADPTIFYYHGTYYLYGTHTVKQGFVVYTSKNLKDWKGPAGAEDGFALRKEDVYGNKEFWAPQVFKHSGKFYMAYTANEHIAIAESSSLLGPFTQDEKKPLITTVKNIDPYVFIDDDGTKYLYHVRLHEGNRLYVVQLTDNFKGVKSKTLNSCINAVEHSQPWENVDDQSWTVTEGPTVLKHKSTYYLFYSANDFRSASYAVGYAVADSPTGSWKKYSENPILSRDLIGKNGTGHGDFFQDSTGQYYYVFHTHYSNKQVKPRRTAIIKGEFKAQETGIDKMVFDKNSFHYLKKQ
jgi:beta-xylosidase